MGIASDHGGYKLKEDIKKKFSDIQWIDYGCDSEDSVDYPDFISILAKNVFEKKIETGIAICGTGIGASMVANRFKGVRAALCHNRFTAEMSKKHNNANILVLGARVLDNENAFEIVQTYLDNEFEGGRHQKRIEKIDNVC